MLDAVGQWEPFEAPPRASAQVASFPRLRYMGSKYRLLQHLTGVFACLEFDTALDAFSGSGVVGYALKTMGKSVTSNDYLHFSSTVARAVIQNSASTLGPDDVDAILGPGEDHRDYIQRTFNGVFFSDADNAFLDSAWSHIDQMEGHKRDLAIASLCLAAARKQPRGVFTVTGFRYDDERRQLRQPLRQLFVEAVADYNAAVFDGGQPCHVKCGDVFALESGRYDLVYLDPPYTPLRDDNDYMKRYHFLEGLSLYWRGVEVMENTKTKKIAKRFTPFAYRHSVEAAMSKMFEQFSESTIVLSYNSQSYPSRERIEELLRQVKRDVRCLIVPHRYHFGTHSRAQRRAANEYVFVAK